MRKRDQLASFFFIFTRCKSRNLKNMMLLCTQGSWRRWNDSLIAALIYRKETKKHMIKIIIGGQILC